MVQALTTTKKQLAKLPEPEFDFSEFGQEPQLLAKVSADPMHIGVVGIVGSIIIFASPGMNLLLLAAFWLFNINDIVWALGEDEEEEPEAVDVQAEEVVETERVPDNWVDAAVDNDEYALPTAFGGSAPSMEELPVKRAFSIETYAEASDMICDGPQALLEVMGDRAPDWVRAAAQTPEPSQEHTPESLLEPVVRAVHEPVQACEPVSNRFVTKPVVEPVRDFESQLNTMVEKGPYVIPVHGPKGSVYHIVRTAINAEKSQNWMVQNLFGASKGNNQPYKDAVAYIQWVKSQ